jgi:hypothetical protein
MRQVILRVKLFNWCACNTPTTSYGVVNDSVENSQRSTLASVSMPVSMDCISQCADEQRAALHQKGALTMRRQALTLRAVDDRKDWFK